MNNNEIKLNQIKVVLYNEKLFYRTMQVFKCLHINYLSCTFQIKQSVTSYTISTWFFYK